MALKTSMINRDGLLLAMVTTESPCWKKGRDKTSRAKVFYIRTP